MNLFFHLFHTGIPIEVSMATILIAMFATLWFMYKRKQRFWKPVCAIWITSYIFLMLYSTVLGRTPHESVSIHLTPIWSIEAIKDGYVETLYEKLYNVLFFIPFGILLAFYIKKKKIWISLKLGFLTSIVIELLQLITRTGTCETDDVICNTLGCALGAMIAVGMIKLYKRFKNTD